jgi:predicted branched-subunit amino acid permease
MTDSKTEFLRGARRSVPIVVAIVPFGLLFGALSVANGLTVGQSVAMSASIVAGASQLVGIQLFNQKVAVWIVVLSIFAVNFRHVLYSAAAGRRIRTFPLWQKAIAFFFLTDPQFAETEQAGEAGRTIRFAWYMGVALPVYSAWLTNTLIGALFGRLIRDPHALGLDFLLTIYFFGIVLSFRRRANWLPVVAVSAAASVGAYHVVGSPWHITLGGLAGVAVAAILGGGKAREADS